MSRNIQTRYYDTQNWALVILVYPDYHKDEKIIKEKNWYWFVSWIKIMPYFNLYNKSRSVHYVFSNVLCPFLNAVNKFPTAQQSKHDWPSCDTSGASVHALAQVPTTPKRDLENEWMILPSSSSSTSYNYLKPHNWQQMLEQKLLIIWQMPSPHEIRWWQHHAVSGCCGKDEWIKVYP